MKQVVYISLMPLTEKVARDWYISHIQANGVSVEFWDVTMILFPGIKFEDPLPLDFMTKITDFRHLESLMKAKSISQTNFVMLVNYEGRFNRLYRMLTRYVCKLYFFEWGNFPIKNQRSFSDKLNRLFMHPRRFSSVLVSKVRGDVAIRLKLVKPFDVVFAAGASSMAMHPQAGRCVAVNLCDYDNYLLAKDTPRVIQADKGYAVFLDNNLAFHSDLKIVGLRYIDSESYAVSLNRFFGMVEEKYRVRVVIAAHPKADYDNRYFEGRNILKGVTPELVKDAEFVISHHTTSISYAVLNRKPLLFIYTNEMARIYRDTIVPWIHDLAEYLGQPVFNIDKLVDATHIAITEPDGDRYDKYKYNYLTSRESEGKLNRDIVLAELTA